MRIQSFLIILLIHLGLQSQAFGAIQDVRFPSEVLRSSVNNQVCYSQFETFLNCISAIESVLGDLGYKDKSAFVFHPSLSLLYKKKFFAYSQTKRPRMYSFDQWVDEIIRYSQKRDLVLKAYVAFQRLEFNDPYYNIIPSLLFQDKQESDPDIKLQYDTRFFNKVVYLKIPSFLPRGTCNEVYNKVIAGHYEKTQNWILDLRGNSGGSTDEMKCLVSLFLGKNKEIYSDKDRVYTSAVEQAFFPKKILILIDEHTASSAELFTGALKQGQLGFSVKVVGRAPTLGKGMEQSVTNYTYQSNDGVLIELKEFTLIQTVSEVFLPGEKSYHKVGIFPDIIAELSADPKVLIDQMKSLQ